ncbi:MAG: hypothetical protein U0670_13155 [Anaerolineae bacterium]
MIKWIFRAALVVLLMGSVSAVFAQSTPEATPDITADLSGVSDCLALMGNPPPLTDPPIRARIVSPEDNSVISGGRVVIEIAAENFSLAEGSHWHVWVDGTLYGMVFEPRTVLTLPPGTYRICANLGTAEHLDLGIPDGITITIQPSAAGTPTPAIDPTVRPPQNEPAANPLLIIVLGGFAAVAGLLVGTRLGKRPAPKKG